MASRNKEAEKTILAGLQKVAGLVRDGAHPNDAITKVASEDGMRPGYVKMMVNAYNIGRTTRQRQGADDLFDKSAEFPLADAAVVLGAMYPAEVKTAAERSHHRGVSEEYEGGAEHLFEKFARAPAKAPVADVSFDDVPAPPPYAADDYAHLEKKADGLRRRLESERDGHHGAVQAAFDKVASLYGDLERYFRTPGCLPFEDVRLNCEAAFGPQASPLFDKLAACGPSSSPLRPRPVMKPKAPVKPKPPVAAKRASVVLTPFKRDASPYREVADLLAASHDYAESFAKAAAFEKAAAAATFQLAHALYARLGEDVGALRPQGGLSILKRAAGVKRAFMGLGMEALGQGASVGLGKSFGESIMSKLGPKPDAKLKDDALESVMDPGHEAKLRAVRTQANLHELLNSPYFEGEDPRVVTDLYNHITKLSPRLADQPLVLEAVMRRHMAQGQADPHDLDQVVGIEHKLKGRDEVKPIPGLGGHEAK